MQIKYNEVDGEYREKLDKLFGVENCLIEVNPGNILIPPKFKELGERILDLEVRPDDVWLASYPRTAFELFVLFVHVCLEENVASVDGALYSKYTTSKIHSSQPFTSEGSTWAQEIVWCLTNNLDYEGAKMLSQMRAPLLELTALFGNDQREWKNMLANSVDQVENMPSPRCIKTHLPWDLLPTQINVVKPKIIYVARNPKDCSVSYYHYCKLIHDFHGTYEDFCELFLLGKTPVGNMWDHVREFWKRRDESNILFLKYEDMKKNQFDSVKTISEFLGKDYSEEELRGLVDHASFSKMRQNPAINLEPILDQMYNSEEPKPDIKFIRKGQVGDWRNYMSNDMADKFDELSQTRWSDIGLTFETGN